MDSLRSLALAGVLSGACLVLSGCPAEDSDPCSGVGGACISVQAEGEMSRLDQIVFMLGGQRRPTPSPPRVFTLPAAVAVIPPPGVGGTIVLGADAILAGTVVAHDEETVVLASDGRGRATMFFYQGGAGPRDGADAAGVAADAADMGSAGEGGTAAAIDGGAGVGRDGSDGSADSDVSVGWDGALGEDAAMGRDGADDPVSSGGSMGSADALGSGGVTSRGGGGGLGTGGRLGTGGSPGAGGGLGSGGAAGSGGSTGGCIPFDKRCNGQVPETCDATGVWQAGSACVNQACVGGVCRGICAPSARRCNGQVPETCDAMGVWQAGSACINQACVGGVCRGVCAPSARQCNGQVPETCDATGVWQGGTACIDQVCVNGVCTGVCAPPSRRCLGNSVEICTAGGQWGNPVACAWPTPTCSGGVCANATLRASKNGTGGGTVSSSPLGINCGGACSASFTSSPVMLSAVADATSDFAGWSGGGCSGTGTCAVDLTSGDVAVTATFARNRPVLTVSKTGAAANGLVTSNPTGINCGSACSAAYNVNTVVELTASADSLAYFNGWSGGGCSGTTTTCSVTMSQAASVSADFGLRPDTLIDRRPPPATNQSTVTVEFSSTEAGGTFECALNGMTLSACVSPQSFTLVGNANNTISITAVSGGARDLSPALVTVRQTPASTPIVQYDFNNRLTNVASVTSGRFDGAGSGYSYLTGKFGQCLKLSHASGGKVTFAGMAADLWDSTSPAWTISLWWREDSPARRNVELFSIRGPYGGWETYHGAYEPVTELTTCSDAGCASFANPTPDTWHSLVYRYDAPSYLQGGAIQLYSDGKLVETIQNSSSLDIFSSDTADLVLGPRSSSDFYSDFYIDEIRIYDRVFDEPTQCTAVIGGTYSGTGCILP